ncbi:hypothetical protein T484DRAFT_1877666, partial [Baffinella frigidus]
MPAPEPDAKKARGRPPKIKDDAATPAVTLAPKVVEDGGEEDEDGDEFWSHGSEFIHRRVRRAVYDGEGEEVVGAADGTITSSVIHVRRAVYDGEGEEVVGAADGTITGWLPKDISDYVSETLVGPAAIYHMVYDEAVSETLEEPAALYHMVYDEAAVGEEDLEEFEVQDGIESYSRDAWATLGDNVPERQARRAADTDLQAEKAAQQQLDDFLRAK